MLFINPRRSQQPTAARAWMPRMKPRLTAKEQREAFEREAQRRQDAGLPSLGDSDAAMDEMVRKSIKDHGA
jgi:hypothetical protein